MGKMKIKARKRRERMVAQERAFTAEQYLAGAPVCPMCGTPLHNRRDEVCGECAEVLHEQTLMGDL